MQNKFQNALIWDRDDNIIAKCPATDDYIALALWVVPGAEYATTFNGDHYTYHTKENLKDKIKEFETASSHGEGERISEMSAEISIYEDYEY